MKFLGLVMTLIAGFIVNFQVRANDDFNSGMNYAKGMKEKELDTFNSFKPADNLPDYSSNPDATKYYSGVQSSGVDLNSPGSNTLNSTEWGKAVIDSISKSPQDMVTADSPFLDNGRNAENKAETVFSPSLCESKAFEKHVFTHYVCDRDLQIQQYCTRKATIKGDTTDSTYITTRKYNLQTQPYHISEGVIYADIIPDVTGDLVSVTYTYQGFGRWSYIDVFGMGGSFRYKFHDAVNDQTLNVSVNDVVSGQKYTFSHNKSDSGGSGSMEFDAPVPVTLTMTVKVHDKVFHPKVEWSETCPFDKSEGSLTSSACIEPGGNKTVYRDAKPYTVFQECWAYKDTYLTQSESEGTCKAYIHNVACNVVNQQCADWGDGACFHANITYSCETKMKGEGQVCGDALFCTDGSCVLDNNGKNDMFAKAASELAAVAAAGKDVAELNSSDVKIFTGKGVSCQKFAAGFSNCCKDSGWGQDVGLASCSSEEKALGKAKDKRLTVYVGEYCSKNVLGICLEKKRGYCEFTSKLAQIVQQQGRAWQLGIGFGSGSSPDCRGITPEELQKIDFSKVDFSAFYDDLNRGSDMPADNNQMEKVKDRMKAMFDQGSSH